MGRQKGGMITCEVGQAYTSTAVREWPRIIRDGVRLSPMSAVVLLVIPGHR